jgi:hypothetical protein
MGLMLEQIPQVDEAGPAAPRTTALSEFSETPRRRTVLRAMVLGAATIGFAAAQLSDRFTSPAFAENGPGGLKGWDRNDCKDAYPSGYSESRDNVGSYRNIAGACFGGTYMGSTYCKSGWHRKETVRDAPVTTTYKPISTLCGTGSKKNAWQWTAAGSLWRCSDGNTTVSAGGGSHTYLTICRAKV